MLSKFSLYNESEMRQWDKFVESHPKGSPYHLSYWMRVLHKTYSFTPFMYVQKNDNENISGIVPCFFIKGFFKGNRIVSLPFTDSCDPLLNDHSQEKELWQKIINEHKDNIKYMEIRGSLLQDSGLVCHNYYKLHVLNLGSDISEVEKNIDKKTIRYSIRKAQKGGIEIREENTQWGIEEIYRLNFLTRKKHGVPPQPFAFFKNIFDDLVLKGYASILLAVFNSKTLAGGVFLKFKETYYYKYNASDPQCLSKQNPNHLLTWHAIQKATQEGYRFFDFGRTSPDNMGLMRYKEMWGAKSVDLPYYYYPKIMGAVSQKESGLLFRTLTRVWQSLPDAVVKRIGPIICKHMG